MPKVSLVYKGKRRSISIPAKATVSELMEKAGINKQTVLIKVGEQIVPDDQKLKGGERVEAMVIVSGG